MAMTDRPVKFLRVPVRMPTRAMLIGTVAKIDDAENIVVLIEDQEGVWMMTEDSATSERINWMLDRAKLLLHKAD